jgi:hypothetical protein
MPPLSPTSSAQEIAQFFIDNELRVRLVQHHDSAPGTDALQSQIQVGAHRRISPFGFHRHGWKPKGSVLCTMRCRKPIASPTYLMKGPVSR